MNIYKLTEDFIKKGKEKSFYAIIYSGLLDQRNFDINDSKEDAKELEEEKLKWLNYFSGLK